VIPVCPLIDVNSNKLANIESTQIGAMLLLPALYERIGYESNQIIIKNIEKMVL
jgi:hypothetical protein